MMHLLFLKEKETCENHKQQAPVVHYYLFLINPNGFINIAKGIICIDQLCIVLCLVEI